MPCFSGTYHILNIFSVNIDTDCYKKREENDGNRWELAGNTPETGSISR